MTVSDLERQALKCFWRISVNYDQIWHGTSSAIEKRVSMGQPRSILRDPSVPQIFGTYMHAHMRNNNQILHGN